MQRCQAKLSSYTGKSTHCHVHVTTSVAPSLTSAQTPQFPAVVTWHARWDVSYVLWKYSRNPSDEEPKESIQNGEAQTWKLDWTKSQSRGPIRFLFGQFSQLVASHYLPRCETKVLIKPVGSKAKVCRPPETPSAPELHDIWKTCDNGVECCNGDTKNKNI